MENSDNKKSCCCGSDSEKVNNTNCCGPESVGSNSSDCCTPKPKSKITKIVFIVVIVAALGIIGYKFYTNKIQVKNNPSACTPSDSTTSGCCEKTTTCCPKK